jgi:DNA-binding PadR family transcriptional regulator
MFGPGDLRLVLLALLADRPRHGYELIRAIEDMFGGGYAPSPGAVYPTLNLLEDEGLLRSEPDEGNRRLYTVTDAGRAYIDEHRATIDAIMDRMAAAAEAMGGRCAPPESIRLRLHTLRDALLAKPGGWGQEEVVRVSEILARAARDVGGRS